jgi:sulfatase maturation enzyme AslB (radical SAM superfamily)
MALERVSIELTNQCAKACWFCYNHSQPTGVTRWQPDDLVEFICDCATHGVQAVSFGGGEPLEYPELYRVLGELRGVLFRSLTSNGLLLDETMARLVEARPDKVHLSIHFPDRHGEVSRVIRQVGELTASGIPSGVNLLVARSNLPVSQLAAERLRDAGIGNDRIVYLPMRGQDTPTPVAIARVAGNTAFQSMSCLAGCARSSRFCSVAWDKTVAWCSYTTARAPLQSLTFQGLEETLSQLGLTFCGGTDEA